MGVASGLISQPGLGRFQLGTAQQQAAVATTGFPLTSLSEQPGVPADPGEVGIQDLDEPVNAGFDVSAVQEPKPVQLGQRWRDVAGRGLADENRDEALGLLARVVELDPADLGDDRIRGDDEHDRVRFGDGGADLLHPAR